MDGTAILTGISLFGSLQALLLGTATVLTTRSRDDSLLAPARRQNYILAALVTGFGGAVAVIALDHAGVWSHTLPLTWIEYTLSLALPPLFLLWARLVVGRPPSAVWHVAHGTPPALWLGASLLAAVTVELWWPPMLAVVLYQVAYTARIVWLAFIEVKGNRGDRPDLSLLRLFAAGFVLVHLAQAVRFLFTDVLLLRDVVPVAATLVLYTVVYRALTASRILQPAAQPYAGSGLASERAKREAARLERLMESERLYLRPDLDLESLAHHMELSRTHLSQVLNQGVGSSFNEFVNRYRLEESERLLSDPDHDHLTVAAIGRRAAFSSRSAFYDAFRSRTGSTPGRFRAESH